MKDLILAKDVGWKLQHPCGDCPFLKTSPFHEGVASSLPMYVETIQDGRFAHTCHKTDNREGCDGPRNYRGEQPQHCVGAALMLLKTGQGMDLQLPLLQAADRGDVDLAALTERAKASPDVFTVDELLRFYWRELDARISTPRAKADLRRDKRRRERKVRR